MNELQKYREQYEEFNCKKNLSGKEALEAVKQDGYNLRYVQEQTPEICLEAVKQDGYALRYVREQTPEICFAAVKRNGTALQYVHEQTPILCLEAVRQGGYNLQYVHEQTPELCLEAARQASGNLQYVDSKFFEDKLMKIEILPEAIPLILNILEIEKARYEKMNWTETEEYKILVDTIKRLIERLADYIEVK